MRGRIRRGQPPAFADLCRAQLAALDEPFQVCRLADRTLQLSFEAKYNPLVSQYQILGRAPGCYSKARYLEMSSS
jgi:hypothetical protein